MVFDGFCAPPPLQNPKIQSETRHLHGSSGPWRMSQHLSPSGQGIVLYSTNRAQCAWCVRMCIFLTMHIRSHIWFIFTQMLEILNFLVDEIEIVGLPILTIRCSLYCGWDVSTIANLLWMRLSCTGPYFEMECFKSILVEVSGHELVSSPTRVFVWFSSLIFPFYKMLVTNRLKFFVSQIFFKTRVESGFL